VIELEDKKVAVVGLGASGLAAARLCLRRGARVVLNDAKQEAQLGSEVRDLVARGASLVAGGHDAANLEGMDLVVVSPGVPAFAALARAERAGVRVVGEVELAVQALRVPSPIVAVGGTNGKSTTTSLIGAMLEAHGLVTFTGGNLGEPLAEHADEAFGAIVLEVSSFQMERVATFKPQVSVLLNVTPDHLDRYATFAAYAEAKGNAFALQGPEDVAVIPHGDEICLRQAARGRGRVVTFGPGGTLDVRADAIVDTRSSERFPRADIAIAGGHNALNAAAAIATVAELGVPAAISRAALATFRGLPHRMVLVGEVSGVRFYDDSKGTNVGAVVTALEGLVEPKAVLIAGGRDKGGSYAPLVRALRDRGRAAVLIGEAAGAIALAIGDALPVQRVETLDDAVRAGAALAHRGDAVLLSPACSSYDMFRDYKHRGDEFTRAVQELMGSRARAEERHR
jgi:UDP-N-acetylmuramoylalanine--D-glutamate ligase